MVLSKLLERHVHKHLVTYLETRDILHPLRSGFRRKHSCNTALARLTDSWLSVINRPDLSGDCFLDLKKRSILLITDSYSQSFLYKQFEIFAFFSVHTLKQSTTCLSVAPTRLKELLNIVCHKGQSWDLYSSVSIITAYLYIYHQTLQLQHFRQHGIVSCKFITT